MAMEATTRRILLVGGTGRTGRFTAAALQARGFTVRTLARDLDTAAAALPAGVELVQGRLQSRAVIDAAVVDVWAVVFVAAAIGSSDSHPMDVDFLGVQAVAAAAKTSGAQHFILLSSAGVTQPEHPHNATFSKVLKYKFKGEAALRASDLDYTIVRALGLRDRPGGQTGVRILQGDRIAFGEDIARADVAEFLAAVAGAVSGGEPAQSSGFAPDFALGSLKGATIEIYNDGRLPPHIWGHAGVRLRSDV
jgi:uncharacterized protein YbjT (DUF2867 family)